jgi:hypothetical protein
LQSSTSGARRPIMQAGRQDGYMIKQKACFQDTKTRDLAGKTHCSQARQVQDGHSGRQADGQDATGRQERVKQDIF